MASTLTTGSSIFARGARDWLTIARQARTDGNHTFAAEARTAVRLLLRAHRATRPGPLHTVPTLAEHLDQLADTNGWERAEYSNGSIVYTNPDTGRELTVFLRHGALEFAFTGPGRSLRTYGEVATFLSGEQVPWIAIANDWLAHRSVELAVKFRRRDHGLGWDVHRADNGRLLGWITSNRDDPKTWDVRIPSGAFLGTGPDDEGDILDHVPGYLHGGSGPFTCEVVAFGFKTRLDAADEILRRLLREHAPAVVSNPGGHYAVTRWADQ